MKCKSCRVETKVVDSRKKSDGVWRRRECPACKTRFNTLEVMDSGRPEVRKPKVAKPKVRKQKVVPRIAVDLFVGNLGAKAQAEALNQGADTAQKLGQVKTQNGRSNAANDVLGVIGNS